MFAMNILVVDNYDSFVYNLVQYLAQLGADVEVVRNDDAVLDDVDAAVRAHDGVLLSPGPGTPAEAGRTPAMIGACVRAGTPALGVCLGHQAIAEHFGAVVDRADELMHGKTSPVRHDGTGILAGIPDPFIATRYHSLTVLPETVPDELVVTGRTDSGMIMAMRHAELPLHGLQFHPESVMTQFGHRMLANWLRTCGEGPSDALVGRVEGETASMLGAAAAH